MGKAIASYMGNVLLSMATFLHESTAMTVASSSSISSRSAVNVSSIPTTSPNLTRRSEISLQLEEVNSSIEGINNGANTSEGKTIADWSIFSTMPFVKSDSIFTKLYYPFCVFFFSVEGNRRLQAQHLSTLTFEVKEKIFMHELPYNDISGWKRAEEILAQDPVKQALYVRS